MANQHLSKNSIYERLFATRHRRSGRPKTREGVDWRLFPSDGVPAVIADVARRRAYAVVHEEQRERLGEVFRAELKVLTRRGVEQVASDAGRPVAVGSDDVEE